MGKNNWKVNYKVFFFLHSFATHYENSLSISSDFIQIVKLSQIMGNIIAFLYCYGFRGWMP